MKTLKIQIPNMQSSHCQMRVANALQTLSGVSVLHLTSGIAEISLQGETSKRDVINTIEKAGYYISDFEAVNDTNDVSGKTFAFKTNIDCNSCIDKIKSSLESHEGIYYWNVDTNNDDKMLLVDSDGITESEVIHLVQNAGFRIEQITL